MAVDLPKGDGAAAAASAAIMHALMNAAGARRKATLDRLAEACREIGAGKPIKLKEIEHYVTRAFGRDAGPRAQTISNEKRLPLGMYHYVEAVNRERKAAGRATRGRRPLNPRSLAERVEAIEDMDLRADMRDAVDRLAAAEAEVARVRALLKALPVGVDYDAFLDGQTAGLTGGRDLDRKSVEALCTLLDILRDDEILARCGLAGRNGRISRRSGTLDELVPAEVMAGVIGLREALTKEEQHVRTLEMAS